MSLHYFQTASFVLFRFAIVLPGRFSLRPPGAPGADVIGKTRRVRPSYRENAANDHGPWCADGGGDQAEGEASHRSQAAIDQAEERHDSAAIGLIGVKLEQHRGGREKRGLKSSCDK